MSMGWLEWVTHYVLPPPSFRWYCSAGSDEKCLQGEWKNYLLHTTNLFFTFNFHRKETEFCLPTLLLFYYCAVVTGILTLWKYCEYGVLEITSDTKVSSHKTFVSRVIFKNLISTHISYSHVSTLTSKLCHHLQFTWQIVLQFPYYSSFQKCFL